jgi:hypothetical protein
VYSVRRFHSIDDLFKQDIVKPDHLFCTIEYLKPWLEIQPNINCLFLAINFENINVAYCCLEISKTKKFGIDVKKIIPIGGGWYSTIVCKEKYERIVIEEIFNYLHENNIEFDIFEHYFISGSKIGLALQDVNFVLLDNFNVLRYLKNISACPYLQCPPKITKQKSLKSLLRQLGCDGTSNLNNQRNRIKSIGFQFKSALSLSESIKFIKELFILHQNRWSQDGIYSRYSKKKKQDSIINLIEISYLSGSINTYALVNSENEFMAVALCYLDANRLYYALPSYNANYKSHSPGKVLLSYIIEDAIDRGITEIDYGPGEEQYKLNWSTGKRKRFKITITGKNNLIGRLVLSFEHIWIPFVRTTHIFNLLRNIKRYYIKIKTTNNA